jgi:hypothetical protein
MALSARTEDLQPHRGANDALIGEVSLGCVRGSLGALAVARAVGGRNFYPPPVVPIAMPLIARRHRSRILAAILAALIAAFAALSTATPAGASTKQQSIMEPGLTLLNDPATTLQRLRLLGVDTIRLFLPWNYVAPATDSHKEPKHFKASDPGAYDAAKWGIWDTIIRDAASDGIKVDLDLGGKSPLWASSSKESPSTWRTAQGSVYPSASQYQSWVDAVGKRYSGNYTPSAASDPLPRVNFWSIWNEPDYVPSLAPQAIGPHNSILVAPRVYRGLVDAGWKALGASGHGHDTIVWGELAPRGYPGVSHGGIFPITFLQSMFCVDSHYRELRGTAASQVGCPTTAAGSRKFRSQNPALFKASGVSDHPYSRYLAPNKETFFTCKTGLCTSLGVIGNLTRSLDKLQHLYGSNKKFPVYSTEYGYQTDPPKPHYLASSQLYFVSVATAAEYLNWAEYISYKNPRIASYDQFELEDPAKPTKANGYGGYSSGLLAWNGKQKVTYSAFRLPLFLPKTSTSHGHSLEVWGGVRPANFASIDTSGSPQTVDVQFAPSGSSAFTTVDTLTISNPHGYFDTHVTFPNSGTVRLTYTYPPGDALLAPGAQVYSRHVTIKVS